MKRSYRLSDVCVNCGHTFGAHLANGTDRYPQGYCPGHEGRMDWENGPGTVFEYRACEACRWSVGMMPVPTGGDLAYECRVNPPTASDHPEDENAGVWPVVMPTDWCRLYQDKLSGD